MEAEFQRCVHEIKAKGATVLLSSHILAEAEALSDRISIIRSGQSCSRGRSTSCATSRARR
jgi:polyether ionophore transport system ATP-binding protein